MLRSSNLADGFVVGFQFVHVFFPPIKLFNFHLKLIFVWDDLGRGLSHMTF